MIEEAMEKLDRKIAASLASQRRAMVRDGLPSWEIEAHIARAIEGWANERPRVEEKMRDVLARAHRPAVH